MVCNPKPRHKMVLCNYPTQLLYESVRQSKVLIETFAMQKHPTHPKLQLQWFTDTCPRNIIVFVSATNRGKVLSNTVSHIRYCRITAGATSAGQHRLVKQKHLINHFQRSINTTVKWRKTSASISGLPKPPNGSRQRQKTLHSACKWHHVGRFRAKMCFHLDLF